VTASTAHASVPHTVAEVTAAWLSQALGERFPAITVAAAEIEEVVHGTATKVRLVLDHDCGDLVPDRLCLKAGLEEHSAMMAATGIYANEANFFLQIRDAVEAAAPRWWWAAVEEGSGRGAVLMDDLARDVRFCAVTQPLGMDEVEQGLGALAALHAARLGAPAWDEWPWLPWSVVDTSVSADYFRTLGTDVVAAELSKPRRGAVVPEELQDPARIVEQFWGWVATNREGPLCLLHGDAHIGNLYVAGGSVGFCDWQTVRYGRPTLDVSYFLGSALTVEDRRSAERALLTTYRDRLASMADGVPSLDDLWFDYRRDMSYGFFAWLTNLDVFQPEEVNVATIERFAAAVLDLESASAVCRPA
jgi:Phosphotransferase enzyme family